MLTLSTTQALVFVMVAEHLLDQQAAHRQVGGDPAIEIGQETAQLLSIAVSQQSIQETVSASCRDGTSGNYGLGVYIRQPHRSRSSAQ